jgi:hypothetical protein
MALHLPYDNREGRSPILLVIFSRAKEPHRIHNHAKHKNHIENKTTEPDSPESDPEKHHSDDKEQLVVAKDENSQHDLSPQEQIEITQ